MRVRSDISIVDSKGGRVKYVFVDGQNVGVIHDGDLVLRKPVSESRLFAVQQAIGKLRIIGPPPEVPEELYY